MRRVIAVLVQCFLVLIPVRAQENLSSEAIMALLGIADIADADQYEIERLSDLLEKPLKERNWWYTDCGITAVLTKETARYSLPSSFNN